MGFWGFRGLGFQLLGFRGYKLEKQTPHSGSHSRTGAPKNGTFTAVGGLGFRA